ncbi:MAG: glycosyltransferase family 4 protein [Candidatus Falkowbacteria bacterium]
MKILLATGIYPPDIGGPATYVKTLKEELPKRGIAFKVLTYGETEPGDEKEGIYRISRKQNVIFRYFAYFRQMLELLGQTDLVYAQDPVSVGLPVVLACLFKRKKYILKIVGDYAWEQGRQRAGVKDDLDEFQNRQYGWRVELWRFIEGFVAKNAAFIITPSEYLKNIVQKWGIHESKIKVIYNAVKEVKTAASRDELRRKFQLDGYVMLSAGRLVPWKGFELLMDLMPEFLKIATDFKLVVIGEGPDKEKLAAKIKKLDLEKSVIMTGAVPQNTLWEYMAAADIFVLNTGYEGLPHITIEAMQSGLPVITTRSGGNPEVIKDGDTGVLADYNDRAGIKKAILKLYEERSYAQKLSLRAKEDIRDRFGRERMIAGVLEIFKSGIKV